MSTDVKKKGFLDSLTDGISKWLFRSEKNYRQIM